MLLPTPRTACPPHRVAPSRLISLLAGLETFISTAKTLPSAGIYDVVEGYIRISVECAEIFKLLDGEKKPESEVRRPWVLYSGVVRSELAGSRTDNEMLGSMDNCLPS